VSSGNGTNPQRYRSKHPYRDTMLVYAALGAVVVVVAYATGSGILKALAGGVSAFVLATAYGWWRLRQRERREAQAAREKKAQ
jgi:membrane protein implicated in regulation of membrane protease activity